MPELALRSVPAYWNQPVISPASAKLLGNAQTDFGIALARLHRSMRVSFEFVVTRDACAIQPVLHDRLQTTDADGLTWNRIDRDCERQLEWS